jgi:hypothetical protein
MVGPATARTTSWDQKDDTIEQTRERRNDRRAFLLDAAFEEQIKIWLQLKGGITIRFLSTSNA